MSISIVEKNGRYLLGTEERASELVMWSSKGEPGQRWIKDFPFGLRLGFVKDGSTPKMYIHWNQHKFNTFLKDMGVHESFSITSYGIRVARNAQGTVVKLLGGGQTSQVLWDSETIEFSREQELTDVNWLVGMVRFSEDGPKFYTTPESQLELEESSAVAIISDKKVPTVAAKIPQPLTRKPVQLSDKARAYLLQDLASSLFIGQMAK
jgi:hypothetical protein